MEGALGGEDLVGPLRFLVGTWRGTGTGFYPTIEPFEYEEELTFSDVGKPYVVFQQRTWVLRDGERRPSHMEFAFWRPQPDGSLEIVSTHANGVTEVAIGHVDGSGIHAASVAIARSPAAKEVTALERDIVVEGDRLRYDLGMAAVGVDLTQHLHAELRRERVVPE